MLLCNFSDIMKQHCFHYRSDSFCVCTHHLESYKYIVNSICKRSMLLFLQSDWWRKCRPPGTGHFTFIELKGATGKWIENKLYHPHWNDKAALSTSHKSLISQPYIFPCNYSCANHCLRKRVRLREINFSALLINSMLLNITI